MSVDAVTVASPSASDSPTLIGNVGVVVTAIDETWSLRETVETLLAENPDTISDILIAMAAHATPACRAVTGALENAYPSLVRRHEQARLPGVGGGIREGLGVMSSPWVLLIASDLETDPHKAAAMIARAGRGDVDVVTASRRLAGASFGDYHWFKGICNRLFQRTFSLLYGQRLTDMTFGFRLYRATELRRYGWSETGHAFFFETLVKPLRGGARVAEVPTVWRRRREGRSHISISEYLRYFKIGLLTRWRPLRALLAATEESGR